MQRVWMRLGVAALFCLLLALWATVFESSAPDGQPDAGGVTEPTESPQPMTEGVAPVPTPKLAGREAADARPDAPDADGRPRVTGRVVDESGQPIAGARVVSIPDVLIGAVSLEDASDGAYAGGVATTDAEGRFAVPVAEDAPYHQLVATAGGFGASAAAQTRPGAEVAIVLRRGLVMAGVVRNLEGRAVPGARVRALVLVDAMRIEREATTDDAGRYRIDGLPPGLDQAPGVWTGYAVNSWFEVTAAEYAPLLVADMQGNKQGETWQADFTLSRGATLRGHVLDAERKAPLPGASVCLYSTEGLMSFGRWGAGEYANPYAPRLLGRTTCGADGSYAFEHVPCKGPHPNCAASGMGGGRSALGGVIAWKAGFTAKSENIAFEANGAEIEVALELWPAATLTGRVVEAGGSPVGEATVSAHVEGRSASGWIPPRIESVPRCYAETAEGTGCFTIAGVAASHSGPTAGQLNVSVPLRFGDARHRLRGGVSVDFEVTAGKATDVGDVVLPPVEVLPTTLVEVLAADGTPCFGALLTRGHSYGQPLRTDREGRAHVMWGAPKKGMAAPDVQVIIRAPGHAPTPASLPPPGTIAEAVRVVLLPEHRLAGRVVTADGTPRAGASVRVGDGDEAVKEVFPPRRVASLYPPLRILPGRALPLVYAMGVSGDNGKFAFEQLPEGPYHVSASAAPRVAGQRPLEVVLERVAAGDPDLVLRLPPDTSPLVGAVEGRVCEAGTGKVVAGASIELAGASGMVASAGVSPSRFLPGTNRGTLDANGAFKLPDLPVGTYRLAATATGYRPQRVADVVVRAGQTTALGSIELDRGVTVRGRIVVPEGVRLLGRSILFRAATRSGRSSYRKVPLDADASFRASGFEAGTYGVSSFPSTIPTPLDPPLVPANGEKLVVGGSTGEVRFDVVLAGAGTIHLRPADDRLPPPTWSADEPTDEQKRFGAATRVLVKNADGTLVYEQTGGIRRGSTGPGGYMVLLPGRYEARLELPGGDVSEETIELEAGARVVVRFE